MNRILVVDDEPILRRTLAFVLRRAGFEVLEAQDGDEALEVARRDRPALVFLDVMMPGRDGFSVLSEVRSSVDLRECRVIMLTAKGQDSDRARAYAAGVDDYLTKPFSPARVVERAREILAVAPR